MADHLTHSERWRNHQQPRRVDYTRPGFVRPPDPEVEDMREPGESFCADCPDHEGCMSGIPCSLVKRLHQEVPDDAA